MTTDNLPDFEKTSDIELRKMADGIQGWSPISAGAKLELERRNLRKQFWKKDIVAWIALIISIISLLVAILK